MALLMEFSSSRRLNKFKKEKRFNLFEAFFFMTNDRLFSSLLSKSPPLIKGDAYEVDWGIFENFVKHYKVESEDCLISQLL